jgi:hypothetical protein
MSLRQGDFNQYQLSVNISGHEIWLQLESRVSEELRTSPDIVVILDQFSNLLLI